MDQKIVSEQLHKITETIREYYINAELADNIASAIEQYIKSEKFTRALSFGNYHRLLNNLNSIINIETDDAHFSILMRGYNPMRSLGIDRYTPNYISIRELVHINDEVIRAMYIKIFDQIRDPLIIDLRDCPGGSPETAYFILSHLFPNGTPLFELQTRATESKIFKSTSELPFYLSYINIKKFTGRLKIIVNGGSASSAETIAFVVQQHKRGKIYGGKTGGHAHIKNITSFGDFDLHLPYARCRIGDKDWEGTGITPDYTIGSKEYINFVYHELLDNYMTPVDSNNSNN